jgi:hypothetical protein
VGAGTLCFETIFILRDKRGANVAVKKTVKKTAKKAAKKPAKKVAKKTAKKPAAKKR